MLPIRGIRVVMDGDRTGRLLPCPARPGPARPGPALHWLGATPAPPPPPSLPSPGSGAGCCCIRALHPGTPAPPRPPPLPLSTPGSKPYPRHPSAGEVQCAPNPKNPRDLEIRIKYELAGKKGTWAGEQRYKMR